MMDSLLPAELIDAARRVVEANRAAGRTVALAESCTGGLVASSHTSTRSCAPASRSSESSATNSAFQTGAVSLTVEK